MKFNEKNHSVEYINRRELQLAILDEMNTEERQLVCEYGFDRAVYAIRLHYGRIHKAREQLEDERKALQVERWRNIT